MISFPNAKINLGLNVVARRSDGYHDFESVFLPLELHDSLEIIEAESTSLTVVGLPVEGDVERNLVVRAFRLLQAEFGLPELKIVLLKKIPMGAGLGGGSADGAFMLKMLNEKFQLQLSDEKLEEYAAKLGADCPFFIKNRPIFAEGIGNIFSEIELDLSDFRMVVVKPDVHISTAEAYASVQCQRWSVPLREALKSPISKWKSLIVNDFEASVFTKYPPLAQVKQTFYDLGAIYASMSGSGSAFYGLFPKAADLQIEPNDFAEKCEIFHIPFSEK